MDHFDEIATDRRLRRDKGEAHLAGPSAGELLDGFRVFSTAGTTGRRGVFVYSGAEFAVWVAAQVRMQAPLLASTFARQGGAVRRTYQNGSVRP